MATGGTVGVHAGASLQVAHRLTIEISIPALIK
jgi:hypothetical protein